MTDWTEDQKAAFVTMQFEAQDRAYHATYPDARFLVIFRGHDAGRAAVPGPPYR